MAEMMELNGRALSRLTLGGATVFEAGGGISEYSVFYAPTGTTSYADPSLYRGRIIRLRFLVSVDDTVREAGWKRVDGFDGRQAFCVDCFPHDMGGESISNQNCTVSTQWSDTPCMVIVPEGTKCLTFIYRLDTSNNPISPESFEHIINLFEKYAYIK